jgi:hypothetical protein
MDCETASLILELQLSDVDEFEASSHGKQREGELTDIELAARIWRQNLENIQTIIMDQRMTQSIAEAIQLDGPMVAQAAQEEQTACEDHVLAHQFNGSSVTSEIILQSNSLNDSALSKLAGLYVSESAGEKYSRPASCDNESDGLVKSSSCTSRGPNTDTRELNRHCVACQEGKKYFDVIAAPCGDEYCRVCLRDLFAASMTDESLFPPRCCRQPITIGSVEIFLTKELKEKFETKRVEFGTPNRTYCSSKSCSAFLTPDQIEDDIGTCGDCFIRTCVLCKLEAHDGDCPNDTALQSVLELATENGWQRCYQCRRLVDLDIGCNHMT